MKKLLCVMVVIMCGAGLFGCGDSSKVEKMTIQPEELSEDAARVESLVKGDMVFAEAKVDDTINGYVVNILEYKDGKWENNGECAGKAKEGIVKLGLRLGDGYCAVNIDCDGETCAYTFDGIRTEFDDYTAFSMELANPAGIEANKEIPLFVKAVTDEGEAEATALEKFRKIKCDKGVVVTVTFKGEKKEK